MSADQRPDVSDYAERYSWVRGSGLVLNPTAMDYMLHNSRDHNFPDIMGDIELKLHHALFELSHDDRALLRNAHHFRDEVLRLREENKKSKDMLVRAFSWVVRRENGDRSEILDYAQYVNGGEEE